MRLDVGAIELRTLSDDYEDPGRPEDDWGPEPEPPGAIRRLVDRPVRVWGAVPELERSVERRRAVRRFWRRNGRESGR